MTGCRSLGVSAGICESVNNVIMTVTTTTYIGLCANLACLCLICRSAQKKDKKKTLF